MRHRIVAALLSGLVCLPLAAQPGPGLFGDRRWRAPVANAAALPASGATGEVRLTLDTGGLYFWDGNSWEAVAGGGGVSDHGALTGLSDDDHAQYALLAGRSGGQTLRGGDAADALVIAASSALGSPTLTLYGPSEATRPGAIFLQATGSGFVELDSPDGSSFVGISDVGVDLGAVASQWRLRSTGTTVSGDFAIETATGSALLDFSPLLNEALGDARYSLLGHAHSYAGSASAGGPATTALALDANGSNCAVGQYPLGVDAGGNVEGCTAAPSASGDVVGPASATDNAIARWDGTTGKLLQSSGTTLSDAGGIETAIVTGSGNIAVRARNQYNDGSKPLSVWNSTDGEMFYLDSTSTMFLKAPSSGGGFRIQTLAGGTTLWLHSSGGGFLRLSGSGKYQFSSSASAADAPDTAITRRAAGVVKIENVLQLTALAAAPTCDSAAAGTLYHDTAPALCWCDGAAWQLVAGVGPCS